jgi:hypothetical protein
VAGDRLIDRLRAIDGEIFIPSHPWYAHLAGKRPFVHRMGILDVTYLPPPNANKPALDPRAHEVEGLAAALRGGLFAAVVLDDHYQPWEFPGLTEGYRVAQTIPLSDSPRTFTGAQTRPHTVWTRISDEAPPLAARVIFDFENGSYDGWEVTGIAWGSAPVTEIPGRDFGGFRGHYFASSYNAAGYPATGKLLSPPFVIAGSKLTLRVGGGSDTKFERAELVLADGGEVVRTTSGNRSAVLETRTWDVRDLAGKTVRLALVDEGSSGWDYLLVDDLLELP